MFGPRSCQATRSRHLFSIAYPTVFFIILPLLERGLTMESATLKDPPAVLGREVESEELLWNQENRHASARRELTFHHYSGLTPICCPPPNDS